MLIKISHMTLISLEEMITLDKIQTFRTLSTKNKNVVKGMGKFKNFQLNFI